MRRTHSAGEAVLRPESFAEIPEIWGGMECSIVRIGQVWRDQFQAMGHYQRPDELARLIGLGIRALRYPILWERSHSAGPVDDIWAWHDARIGALQAHGVAPIAGLLHHGSGPPGTDLLDPAFPDKLAAYAAVVAERYPQILAWTPVNEPLTTARFSCLYGHWYPHLRDEDAFLRALVNQCRAVLLAMRAIRRVVGAARLIQTEDIGKIYATRPLLRQARYENARRWLSLDLLCGQVTAAHPWRRRLLQAGVPERDLDEFLTGEATPDIIGVNYYVTSERYLDHRIARHPDRAPGGNGRQTYVDLEAVRADPPPADIGWSHRLREVWQRYRRPMAITEVHLACDDAHEPLRWLMEAWEAVATLRGEGADIRAVTPWAMLGAVDWHTLLCRTENRYEPGLWDMQQDPPRAMPLLEAVTALARDGHFEHPALLSPGWWRRGSRVVGSEAPLAHSLPKRPPVFPPSLSALVAAAGE